MAEPQAAPGPSSSGGAAAAGPADPAAAAADWVGFDRFAAVQHVLDRNAVLIAQIDANHRTRTPEALRRNVVLVRELNANVRCVVDLYGGLAEQILGEGGEEGAGEEEGGALRGSSGAGADGGSGGSDAEQHREHAQHGAAAGGGSGGGGGSPEGQVEAAPGEQRQDGGVAQMES
jgi:hypothetical protein